MDAFTRLRMYTEQLMNGYNPGNVSDVPVVLYDHLLTQTVYDEDETYTPPILYEEELAVKETVDRITHMFRHVEGNSEQLLDLLYELVQNWLDLTVVVTRDTSAKPSVGLVDLLNEITSRITMYFEVDLSNVQFWLSVAPINEDMQERLNQVRDLYTLLEPTAETERQFLDQIRLLYLYARILLDPVWADWLPGSWFGRAVRRYLFAVLSGYLEQRVLHLQLHQPGLNRDQFRQELTTATQDVIKTVLLPELHDRTSRLRDVLMFNNEVSYEKYRLFMEVRGTTDIYPEEPVLLEMDVDKLADYIVNTFYPDSEWWHQLATWIERTTNDVLDARESTLWDAYTRQDT